MQFNKGSIKQSTWRGKFVDVLACNAILSPPRNETTSKYFDRTLWGYFEKLSQSECQWYHLKACLKSFTMSINVAPNCLNQNANGTIWKLVSRASQWVPMLPQTVSIRMQMVPFESLSQELHNEYQCWWVLINF
jgi:hypothetical protein